MKYTALLFLFLFSFSSCGDTAPPKRQATESATTAPRLKVYAYRYLASDQSFYQQFTQRTDIAVDVYLLSRKEMLGGLRDRDLSQADILLLPDLYTAELAEKSGVLQPFLSEQIDINVANIFLDLQGFWMGMSRTTMGAVFPQTASVPNRLLTYENIVDPSLKGKVVMGHPDSTDFPVMIAGMLVGKGEGATRKWLEKLQNVLAQPPSGNDYAQIQAVQEGKASVALLDIPTFLRYRHSGNPDHFTFGSSLAISIPMDSENNNYYNLSVACLPAQVPHRKEAIQLLEFMTGPEVQSAYADAVIEYPVNPYSTIPDHLLPIEGLPQGDVMPEDIENQVETARRLIRETLGM